MQTFPLKFVLVGDLEVGKTQLSKRFVKGEFLSAYTTTSGMEFSTKSLPFERCNLNAQIWDVSGKERGTKKNTQFFKDAVGAVLVYDITNRQSFENVKNMWLGQIQEFGHANINVMLIGNKLDCKDKRQVETEEAIEFAKLNSIIGFTEVSALTGECVNVGFRRVIFQVASILPAVKVHLDQLGLPLGWRIAHTEQSKKNEIDSDSESVVSVGDIAGRGKPKAALRKKDNGTIHTYSNYWTDENTMDRPTMPAQHHLLYVRAPRRSSTGSTESPRGSSSELKPFNVESSSGTDNKTKDKLVKIIIYI